MEEKGGGVWGSSANGLRHNTQRVCSHSITTISKHQNWIMELEYLFYRINVDPLIKLLGLVTYENRSPMSWHTFLSFIWFSFPYFPLFINFLLFWTFMLFILPWFSYFILFSGFMLIFLKIFIFAHFWKLFWTLVLTWLGKFISTSFNCIINKRMKLN